MSALWTLSTAAAVDALTSRLLHSSSPDCMDLRHKSMRTSISTGNVADSPSDGRRPSSAQYSLCRGDCALHGHFLKVLPEYSGTGSATAMVRFRRQRAFNSDNRSNVGR